MKKKQPKTEEIGIRELKSRASEVVRAVKEVPKEGIEPSFP
jgi:hypothetical protein